MRRHVSHSAADQAMSEDAERHIERLRAELRTCYLLVKEARYAQAYRASPGASGRG